MAQSSFPFENVDTTETQFSQMFRTLNAGVNGTPAGTELKVSAGTGLQVSVALGQAMVRGHYYISTATELLTIGTANPSNPRIDTVVLRLDPVANSIVLAVVAGTAAASPVAPTLTQTDAGVFEFPLANVAVAAGAGTVGTITDRRVFMGKRLQSVGTSAAREIVFPAPVQGDMVWRDDLGALETYYGLYNASTNPGGRDAAGWYANDRQTGLIPIQPTSVAIASGSGSVNSLGKITFGGATVININGVFTSKYNYYKIVWRAYSSQGTQLWFTMRANGVNATTSYYSAGQMVRIGGTVALTQNNETLGRIALMDSGYTAIIHSGEIELVDPAIPEKTTWRATSIGGDSTGGLGYSAIAGTHGVGTAYDGITIYPAGGVIAGSIQIFGYNDK